MMLIRAAALIATTASIAFAQPASNVMLDAVTKQTVTQQREATGEVYSLRRAAVATQESGLVTEMELNIGDRVEKGQVIARLDDERARLDVQRLRARVRADEAVIEQRKAELAQAERDLGRYQKLSDLGSVGASELDDATTLVQSRAAVLAEAEAELMTDQADLALAERTLTDMSVRAPFAGSVVAKQTELGQWVSVGTPIVTIVSLTELEARADIPERSVAALYQRTKQGPALVELNIPAIGGRVMGTLTEIVPQADSLSRLFPIRVKINDPEVRLAPGMSLTALVPTGETVEAITISEDAILRNAAGEYVYFDAGGVAQVAPITRLFQAGDRVAVRSPVLQPGMLLVVEGNERLYPTAALNVLNADKFPEVAERQKAAATAAAQEG